MKIIYLFLVTALLLNIRLCFGQFGPLNEISESVSDLSDVFPADLDGDGDLSPLEITGLSMAAALSMLNTLSAADTNMDDTDTSAEANKDAFGDTLSSVNSEIGVLVGDTEEEKAQKLRDFLGGDS